MHDTFLRVLTAKEIRISVIDIQQPESDIGIPFDYQIPILVHIKKPVRNYFL